MFTASWDLKAESKERKALNLQENLTTDALFGMEIEPADKDIYRKIKENWDGISKPIDGLGDFEEVISRIGAIQRITLPRIENRCLVVMCSDNGIVEEGISQTGKEVTYQVAKMLGEGKSTANTMGKEASARCFPVDIGIDYDGEIPGVLDCKIKKGTSNFLKSWAMAKEDALSAIAAGISVADRLAKEGTDLIATGEMGIGNTTTTSALLCLLFDEKPESFVGRGAGLDDEGLSRKIEVVRKALDLYKTGDAPDRKMATFEHLCQVGGFDIAGLCGVFIGGARNHVPIVIDGVISAVSALLAETFVPGCRDYMIASHSGRETGLMKVLEELSLKPYINGNMALGEGTGALMLFPLLDVAYSLYSTGSTFNDGGIKEYQRFQ